MPYEWSDSSRPSVETDALIARLREAHAGGGTGWSLYLAAAERLATLDALIRGSKQQQHECSCDESIDIMSESGELIATIDGELATWLVKTAVGNYINDAIRRAIEEHDEG